MPYIDSFNVGNVVYDMRDKNAGLYTADEYSSSGTYAIGNFVTHDGKLYECNTDIPTPEAWTPAHWTETTMADETATLQKDVSQLKNIVSGGLEEIEITNEPIASFTDGANDAAVKSFIVNVTAQRSGSGDATPSNVRNISGFTESKITHTGKNLFDQSRIVTQAGWLVLPLDIPAGHYYTFSTNMPNNQGLLAYFMEVGGSQGDYQSLYSGKPVEYYVTKPMQFVCRRSSGTDLFSNYWFQLEAARANSITEYEPFHAEIETKQFPNDAGTVYVGTLDIINGILTKTHALYEIKNVASWAMSPQGNNTYRAAAVLSGAKAGGTLTNIISNMFESELANVPSLYHGCVNGNGALLLGVPTTINTNQLMVDWCTTYQPQIIAELQTPVTYNLTPEEVKTFLENNNFYASSGNVNTLIYYANTGTSIELAKAIIAPVLESAIADTALVANDFRIVGNQLYRITTNIASGAALIPNTNCTAVTVADILKALLT